ncbi:hypothetical protein SPKIRA_08470 [Sphingomonas paucimobilis]|nr:hypothetical protein SPKIRA_08470 [Sphingomonas paucimobilis]
MASGCKTSGDLRVKNVLGRSETTQSVQAVAGCIALAISGRGIEISQEPIPNGTAVSAAMRVTGVKSVINVYDIEDLGERRRVTFYGVGGQGGEGRPITGPAAKCIQ